MHKTHKFLFESRTALANFARKCRFIPHDSHPLGLTIPKVVVGVWLQLIQVAYMTDVVDSMNMFIGKVCQWADDRIEYAKIIGLRTIEITGADGEEYTVFEFHATSHVILSRAFGCSKTETMAKSQIGKLFIELEKLHGVKIETLDLREQKQFEICSLLYRHKKRN